MSSMAAWEVGAFNASAVEVSVTATGPGRFQAIGAPWARLRLDMGIVDQ